MMELLLNMLTPQINMVTEIKQTKGITIVTKSTWLMFDFSCVGVLSENPKKSTSSNLLLDKMNPLFFFSRSCLLGIEGKPEIII